MAEEKKGYTISDIYQGGYSSLKPKGPYVKTGSFGLTTDPRNANLLQDVSTKLSTGVKHIEVEALIPEVFDAIPKPHLKEVARLSKLTGTDISLHGPVINTTGLGRGGFSETEREAAERTVTETLLRSHELNPKGNITVNFHSGEALGGSQLIPPTKRKEGEKYKMMLAVDRDTGRQMVPLEKEVRHYPHMEKLKPEIRKMVDAGKIPLNKIREEHYEKISLEEGKKMTPEQRIEELNATQWDNQISQLLINKERMDEILEKNRVFIQHVLPGIIENKIDPRYLEEPQAEAFRHFQNAHNYLEDLHKQANALFSKAWEFGDGHQREILKSYSEEFKKQIEDSRGDPFTEAQAMHNLLIGLKSPKVTPKMFVPIEEFALEKSSKTFGNAAFESYKKFKDKAPVLVIENPPASFVLSTGEDIKNIVEKSRKQFVEKAVDSGMSERDARKQAEKFIGATWDIGHINMLRKHGYSEEEIVKEAEAVKDVLKHVHLSDNFGFEHTELPMGMGNVPWKEIMEKLGKKGFEAKKIIEAGSWWQHFKTPPVQETIEAAASPVYAMKMAPYWAQAAGLYQGYFSGYGQMLPQINYETFGGSFARLPAELGGQMPGAQGSRMSGRGME